MEYRNRVGAPATTWLLMTIGRSAPVELAWLLDGHPGYAPSALGAPHSGTAEGDWAATGARALGAITSARVIASARLCRRRVVIGRHLTACRRIRPPTPSIGVTRSVKGPCPATRSSPSS